MKQLSATEFKSKCLALIDNVQRTSALWIERALEFPHLKLLPLTPAIATMAARLPAPFHGDPADRMIAATCLKIEAALVTKDAELRRWRYRKTIW